MATTIPKTQQPTDAETITLKQAEIIFSEILKHLESTKKPLTTDDISHAVETLPLIVGIMNREKTSK